jgi:hypothetical protein
MTTVADRSGVDTGVRGDVLGRVAWCSAAALLCWLGVLHLGAVLSFAVGAAVSPALAPVGTAAALGAAWWFARRSGLATAPAVTAAVVTAASIAGGLVLAATFIDLTWDGQWYHQTAVYKMAEGWNPLRDPLHAFGRHTWNLWVLHYAKGPWYVALALFATTGNIEVAKVASALTPAIALLVVLASAVDLGLERRWAVLVALLTALNPVATCGIVTHQVDGILVSLMACAVAAGVIFLRRPAWLPAVVVFVSSVLCINTKFTGLVYLCFFFLAGGLYCLWGRRDLVVRYGTLVGAALIVGTVALGFNPYVTNTVHRGHPFYPVQGSAGHPGLADRGRDPIELYETPRNMMGRNRFLRLAYGVFGKPGTAPYVTKDAEFMWPFAATWSDFELYYFHDVRIGGFGPLFSGALLLAVALTVAGGVRRELPVGVVLLLAGTIVASLLVSTHTWWARYGPHLWWLPIVPVAAALRLVGPPWLKRAAAAIALILLVDTLLLSAVHARWEWRSTQALRQQLADLRQAGQMTVDLAYFDVPVAERFRVAGVAFDTVPKYECPAARQLTLMSVCRGYPEWIRICLADQARAAQLQTLPHWQWSAEPTVGSPSQ